MDTLTLSSGKIVSFEDDSYTPQGVVIKVKTPLSKDEKREFRKEVSYERDIAAVYFN